MHTDWKKSRVKLNESRCLSLNCDKASNVSVSHTLCSFPAAASPNLGSSTGRRKQGRIKLPTYHTPAHQGCSVRESLAEPTWQRISKRLQGLSYGSSAPSKVFPHLSSRPVAAHSCLRIQWKADVSTTLMAPAGMLCLGREFSSYRW